jgi:hypothetical protein
MRLRLAGGEARAAIGGRISSELMRIATLVAAALLFTALPSVSFADTTNSTPEPETLGLIAGAAIAWAIVRWKKRK